MKIKLLALLVLSFAFGTVVQAQEVTDYDLQNFAYCYVEMMDLNMGAQEEMMKIIEKEDLDLDVYHAIDESKDTDYEPDVDEEEFVKYEKIQPEIIKINDKLEKELESAFAKHDMTIRQYRAIAERVKQDYILQAKLEKMLQRLR